MLTTEEQIQNTALRVKQLSEERSAYTWIRANKLKNEKGEELEFKNRSFLIDILEDFSQTFVVRKASQIGFSVTMMLKSLWAAKYKKWNVIYTLPTSNDVNELVSSKVNALISQNAILQDWTQDKDSIFQKKVGNCFIYYRGTFSAKKETEKSQSAVGIMISSDWNIHDECDRSDQLMLEQYESRLAASDYSGRAFFSNPTVPSTYSQQIWDKSDQKHWFVRCRNGHLEYLDFFKGSVEDGKYVCKKCKVELSDEERRKGQWVKKNTHTDISGYWINHLMCPWIKATKIEQEFKLKTKDYFYNFVLGLPYIGSDVVVDKTTILRCITQEKNFKEHVVLGADSGLRKHFVIGNREGIFKIGVADKWEEIEEYIRKYDIEVVVLDALPDLTEPRKMRDKFPGIVYLNYYKKDVRKADYIKWDDKTNTIYSDRTKLIQLNIDELNQRKIRFNLQPEELGTFIDHWKNLYKIKELDSMGIERDLWKSNGEDHFVHALSYWRIAMERQTGHSEIQEYEGQPSAKIIDGRAPIISDLIREQYNGR